MFIKRIDERNYVFRMYWDAAIPGPYYWIVVEMTSQLEADHPPSEPVPEDVVNRVQQLLEKSAGFPNVPAPSHDSERTSVRFKILLSRTPNGACPRRASDWMKLLEKTIQVQL